VPLATQPACSHHRTGTKSRNDESSPTWQRQHRHDRHLGACPGGPLARNSAAMKCAIIVHGGLQTLAPAEHEIFGNGCVAAVDAGWEVLRGGGSALDAAEAAVRALEDDPIFNAGLGSTLNAEGEVELDAAIMDGSTLQAGAVAVLRGVRHPITIARRLMESGKAVMLAGDGAQRFASDYPQELCAPDSLITDAARREWQANREAGDTGRTDTVGCVALDEHGRIAAATSTGGIAGKPPGRVGDSPLVGCGVLADELGGVSLTGDGESIIRTTLASRILTLLGRGLSPDDAAEAALRFFQAKVPGNAGCIVLDRQGRIGLAHTSPNIACAYRTSAMPSAVAMLRKA
jgi:beta-aspartyl-peptidase (threonine type)